MASNVIPLVQFPKPPADLARLPSWVIWRFEQHAASEKPRKMPYYASTNTRRAGAQGGSADRAQLSTFKEALAAATKFKADGIGLAILPSLGIVAVDFDNCVDEGRVRDDVAALVSSTYAELSPSGRGVRAFFKGQLASRKSFAWQGYDFDVEFFGSSGFVTYTGNVLDACAVLGNEDTVAELTPEILALYKQRFDRIAAPADTADRDPLDTYEPRLELTLEQMREALARLSPDMPEPDWVKVGWAIAHETDKSDEGLALWHEWSSGGLQATACARYDERVCDVKWAYFGRHQGTPITFRSVLKMARDASAKIEQAARRKRFEVVPAMEFAARPPPCWIVKGVIPEGALGMVYGESGSGKSFFVLDLAAAISNGTPWRQARVSGRRCVYIGAEGAGGLVKRVKAYMDFHGAALPNLGVIGEAPNLLDADDVDPLIGAVKAFGEVGVVIVDTLAQTTPGANENAAEDMGKALAHCKRIHEETGALVLLVHHSGKDAARGARGWSGIKAACDVEIELTRVDHARCATVTKLKDGEDGAEFGFTLQRVDLGKDADGEPITSCVVREAEVVKRPPVQGKWQAAVWQALHDFVGLTGEGMERVALVEEAVRLVHVEQSEEQKGRNRGRENAARALAELCKKGALHEREGFVYAN